MSLSDYGTNNIIIDIFNEMFDKKITHTFDMNDSLSKPLVNIGGYPDFTQQDPRCSQFEKKDKCLIKIDSYLDKRLQIGDSGIIFSFIKIDDLKNVNLKTDIVIGIVVNKKMLKLISIFLFVI